MKTDALQQPVEELRPDAEGPRSGSRRRPWGIATLVTLPILLAMAFFYAPEELAVLEVYRDKLPRHARSEPNTAPSDSATAAQQDQLAEQCAAEEGVVPPQPTTNSCSLTLFQANILVAMLAGFWARKGDGHPGPKLLAQGLMILAALVNHQQFTASAAQPGSGPKQPREPG